LSRDIGIVNIKKCRAVGTGIPQCELLLCPENTLLRNSAIFWVLTPYVSVEVCRRLGGKQVITIFRIGE
jgi:hypothetical protein